MPAGVSGLTAGLAEVAGVVGGRIASTIIRLAASWPVSSALLGSGFLRQPGSKQEKASNRNNPQASEEILMTSLLIVTLERAPRRRASLRRSISLQAER